MCHLTFHFNVHCVKVNLHACIYKTIHLSWQWLHSYKRLYFNIKHGLTDIQSETYCTTTVFCKSHNMSHNFLHLQLNIVGRCTQSSKKNWLKINTIYAKLDNRMYDGDSLHKDIYCTLPPLIRALPCKTSN